MDIDPNWDMSNWNTPSGATSTSNGYLGGIIDGGYFAPTGTAYDDFIRLVEQAASAQARFLNVHWGDDQSCMLPKKKNKLQQLKETINW